MANSKNRRWSRGNRSSGQKTGGSSPNSRHLAFESLEDRRMLSLSVPALNSRPGAAQSLYLDFNGSPAFSWNNGEGNFTVRGPNSSASAPAPVQAFSLDGDFDDFSDAELTSINHIWQWVAEKYSPFTINVTTVDPGYISDGLTMRCLIAGSNSDWYRAPKAGGTSSIGGFHDGGPNTCFMFSADAVANGGPGASLEHYLGEGIAHEAGHEVGLVHETSPGDDYYDGDALRSPIMGDSGNNSLARGLWWRTNNFAGQNSTDPVQDELQALTQGNDRLQYATHTGGGTLPFTVGGTLYPVKGIINHTTDVDAFAFTATAARATFTISNAPYGGMLAPNGNILIAGSQTQVPTTITLTNTSASISASNLTVGGHYVLQVFSQGQYGDIGQYTITGSQQQAFASFDPVSGQVNVVGLVGNNNVTLSRNFTNGQYQLLVQDSLNGGPTLGQDFLLSNVTSVSVNLGAGDDTLNVGQLFKTTSSSGIPVSSSLGGGFDTLKLSGTSGPLSFDVDANLYHWTDSASERMFLSDLFSERIELHGTNFEDDAFKINSQNTYSTIYAYGGSGNDKLVIGYDVAGSNDPPVFFYGEEGVDTLEIDGSPLGLNQNLSVAFGSVDRLLPTSPFVSSTKFDSTVENINLKGGSGDDTFELDALDAGQTASVYGNSGDDTFRFGRGQTPFGPGPTFSQDFRGIANVYAGLGDDQMLIVDTTNTGGFTGLTISNNSVFSTGNTLGESTVSYDSYLESMEVDSSNSGAYVTLLGLPSSATLVNLVAGTGVADKLIIDDTSLAAAPFRVDLNGNEYQEYYGDPQAPTVRQLPSATGFETLDLKTNAVTNEVNVYALPAERYTNLTAGTTAVVTLYPHDGEGAQTINGDLSVSYADSVVVDDTASNLPLNYVYTTNSLGLVDLLEGLGSGDVSFILGVANLVLKAGDGDDTFSINQHKHPIGLAIHAGDGDDTLNFGDDDLAANVTSLSSFLFDGQTGFDRFNLDNGANTSQWQYVLDAGTLRADRLAPTAGYTVILNEASVEESTVNAGPDVDAYYVRSVDPWSSTVFNAGDGLDGLVLADSTQDLSNIQGPITYNSAGSNGNMLVSDNADTRDHTAHLTANSLGAAPGDDLFGPGGALFFDDVVDFGAFPGITLNLGSGTDTLFAEPLTSARVAVNGANPTAAPGDTLHLRYGNVTNPLLTPAGTGAGTYTFDDAQEFSYTGFETTTAGYFGDFDHDNMVDAADLAAWDAAFGDNVAPGDGADGDGNGQVDGGDFLQWQRGLGAGAAPAAAAASSGSTADSIAAVKSGVQREPAALKLGNENFSPAATASTMKAVAAANSLPAVPLRINFDQTLPVRERPQAKANYLLNDTLVPQSTFFQPEATAGEQRFGTQREISRNAVNHARQIGAAAYDAAFSDLGDQLGSHRGWCTSLKA